MSPRHRALALSASLVALLAITAVVRRGGSGPLEPRTRDAAAAPRASEPEEDDRDASAAAWFAPRAAVAPHDAGAPPPTSTVATTDPELLGALEASGLALGDVLGGPSRPDQVLTNRGLYANAPAYRDVVDVLRRDLAELSARKNIGEGSSFGNHAFPARWLSSGRTRFELVGALERFDRRTGDPARGCGELRLVYRLTADPPDRPPTRLPMTLNVLLPEAAAEGGGCREVAASWGKLRDSHDARARLDRLRALFARAGERFDQIEVNLQNLHGPSLRVDMDDHAEYVLRAFDADRQRARPRPLFDTPRLDLDAAGRQKLLEFVRSSFAQIDDGTWVLPRDLLAERVVSVTPRGAERPANRPFTELFADPALAKGLEGLPYATARFARSPRSLLRRLDEGTCAGCHQTRAIAGFHLLGEDRVRSPFNALATAGSPHFHEDLRWREEVLSALERAQPMPPRPAAARGLGAGGYGTSCGLADDGARGWDCRPGLVCTATASGTPELGLCLPPADAREPGDPCQKAAVVPRPGPDGDRVKAEPLEPCANDDAQCSPNGFGFPGGLCSAACDTVGDARGDSICVDIPSSGYESECFFTPVPIERCLETHRARRRVRSCDAEHPCRPDFACVAVPGETRGACVPPYFVFQARVDGPLLDRP